MNCTTCNKYFKQNAFNNTSTCEDCSEDAYLQVDSEIQVDLGILRNPSGKTNPVFYDEHNDPEMDVRDSI